MVTFVVLIVVTEISTARWIETSLLLVTFDGNTNVIQQDEDPLWNFIPPNSKEIRRWGCNRTETPFIFVHIGKAGGGSVGSRIEAASLNYTKLRPGQPDGSYYPLSGGGKARFVRSCFSTHLPSQEKTYEGTNPCHASTPLGQAIGCPETLQRILGRFDQCHGECDPFSETCHLVYMGHNFFGSEMHWLPVKYLQTWWRTRWDHDASEITPLWEKLLPDRTWCSSKNESRPARSQSYKRDYEECSVPLQREVDSKAMHALSKPLSVDDANVATSWSPVYASLPVLRVTVMRNPFTWLVSKYFWHRTDYDKANNSTCDNVEEAVLQTGGMPRNPELDMDSSGPGWITRMSLGYIMYLCGEDCIARYAAGTATLADLKVQAEGNLRRGFAVVGILEEVDVFYEMLTARVQYMNSSLNMNVRGARHSTRNKESNDCKRRFEDPDFQAKLLELSPELRALNRLYEVAKEVNRFQLQELRECSAPNEFSVVS